MSNARDKARDRLPAIAQTLQSPDPNYGLPQEFMTKLRAALAAGPLLPRADPSISLWQEPPHPNVSNIQSPSLPRFADFVVIGSGITGCSVTKSLLEDDSLHPASRVVVLEARTLTSGAPGRNSGQLVSPVGHTYSALCRRHGEDAAKEMSRFSLMNIDRVMSMVKDLDPELQGASEIRKVSKVMVSGNKETWEASRKSLDAFRDAIPEHRTLHGVTEKEDLVEVCPVSSHMDGYSLPAIGRKRCAAFAFVQWITFLLQIVPRGVSIAYGYSNSDSGRNFTLVAGVLVSIDRRSECWARRRSKIPVMR